MEPRLDGSVRIVRRGRGFAAWGPGFYVWEEDAAELLGAAGALARAGRSGRSGELAETRARAPRREAPPR